MKRTIAITTVVVLACAPLAMAQSAGQSRPIAEVARDEEARRNSVKKPAKVYTNGNLRTDISAGVAAPPSTPSAAAPSGNTTPGNVTPGAPAAGAPPAQDQAAWQNRIRTAREQVTRTQMFADSLQTRINSLTADFVNRDDPGQKAKIEADRKAALAELERVKKELEEYTKAVKAIEEEARRSGVPAGWIRPGA